MIDAVTIHSSSLLSSRVFRSFKAICADLAASPPLDAESIMKTPHGNAGQLYYVCCNITRPRRSLRYGRGWVCWDDNEAGMVLWSSQSCRCDGV